MDIKELAKKLCDESGCHHKCKDIDECVVMEEAEELLINQDKSNNFDVKSNNLPFVLTNEDKVSVKGKCDSCMHSRLVLSENGWHRACCLSQHMEMLCVSGKVNRHIPKPHKESEGTK